MRKYIQGTLAALMLGVATAVFAGPVDINHADAGTLAKELKGVGTSKAEAIVAYRKQHGPFKSAEDLSYVKGIGSKTIEMNKDNIRLDSMSKN
ncbi:MAG: helix-hairpin-helix domain-containing protein [Gammaproteobacteria bacterium]|jgi:competence protein ComEA